MGLIPMPNIRASDNSEIHLECLPPLFSDCYFSTKTYAVGT